MAVYSSPFPSGNHRRNCPNFFGVRIPPKLWLYL
jgi:hypothetical protein